MSVKGHERTFGIAGDSVRCDQHVRKFPLRAPAYPPNHLLPVTIATPSAILSWARGNQGQASDIDLLLLSDCADEYRHSQEWLAEIDFPGAGYRFNSSENANYGVVWSRHIHLLPAAEVELTFAGCCWAQIEPIDDGTRSVVKDAFQIIFDKDGMLSTLIAAVMSG
jgi:hypothetical protein